MDSVVEKQGFYDYINHIIVGFVFLLGIEVILIGQGVYPISHLYGYLIDWSVFNSNNNLVFTIIGAAILILVCFIIGAMAQEVHINLFEINHKKKGKKFKKEDKRRTMISRFWRKTNRPSYGEIIFTDEEFFGNSLKYNSYWNLAVALVKDKSLNVDLKKNKEVLSSYFFAYCDYYNQVNGNHKKAEKLRDIEGLTLELSLIFTALSGMSGLSFLIRGTEMILNGAVTLPKVICCAALVIVFAMLAIGFDCVTERAVKNRIKMTIAVFEVNKDIQKEKQKKEQGN